MTLVLDPADWNNMMKTNGWNSVSLRDDRYQQVIHMVDSHWKFFVYVLYIHLLVTKLTSQTSAANGAESFYQTENNAARKEGVELARILDDKAQNVKLQLFCDFLFFSCVKFTVTVTSSFPRLGLVTLISKLLTIPLALRPSCGA